MDETAAPHAAAAPHASGPEPARPAAPAPEHAPEPAHGETPAVPADRYGRPPRPGARRRTVAALWALGVVGAAVAVWLGLGAAATPVRWSDVGFVLDGARGVAVDFDVVRTDPALPVRCRLQALNQQYAQVGVVEVDVPAATERTVRLRVDVATSEAAVTGVVESCWALDD